MAALRELQTQECNFVIEGRFILIESGFFNSDLYSSKTAKESAGMKQVEVIRRKYHMNRVGANCLGPQRASEIEDE